MGISVFYTQNQNYQRIHFTKYFTGHYNLLKKSKESTTVNLR